MEESALGNQAKLKSLRRSLIMKQNTMTEMYNIVKNTGLFPNQILEVVNNF